MQKMSRYKYFVNSGVKDSGGIVCFIYNAPWYGMHKARIQALFVKHKLLKLFLIPTAVMYC